MAKKKITTPKGTLSWVFIDGEGSYNDLSEKYEYKATLTLPRAEAQPLMDMADALWEGSAEASAYKQAYAAAKPVIKAKFEQHSGYKIVLDDDTQKETGFVEFRFKTGTTFKPKKEGDVGKPVKIDVYNSKAQKVQLGETKIGNESVGRISGQMSTWFRNTAGGVSLYLSSVQLIVLEEYVENEFEDEGEDEGNFKSTEENSTSNEFTGVETEEPEDTSTADPNNTGGGL